MRKKRDVVLGVDIGGTNIKVGQVSGNKINQTALTVVNPSDSMETTLKNLFKVIEELMTDTVEAIGIGVPAVVDVESGIVYDVQNIPSWKKISLKKLVQDEFGIPVYINNDANCFLLGEKWFGKAQAYPNCIALSLGTGLGMGISINGGPPYGGGINKKNDPPSPPHTSAEPSHGCSPHRAQHSE
mgnify:CR=1 FL=1